MILITDLPLRYTLKITILAMVMFVAACKKDVLSPEKIGRVNVGTEGTLYDILFINDSVGFIAGGERYLRSDLLTTTDGGETWSLFHFGEDAKKAVYKLSHVGEKIYAVGLDGKFITKRNSSSEWQYIQTAWWQWYESIIFPESDHGYIAVNMGFASGAILQTDSLGNLFKIDSFPCSVSDLSFSSAETVYACGYGTILKTEDGGATWKIQEIAGDNFKSICCIDNHVWAVGNNGSIVHSGNGGKTWEHQRNGNNLLIKKYRLNSVFFKDPATGYASGDNGLLLKTTDGGAHWVEFEHFTDNDLMAVAPGPSGSIWVTGYKGTVFRIRE